MKLEEDTSNLESRNHLMLFPGIEIENSDFTYADTSNHIADILLININN